MKTLFVSTHYLFSAVLLLVTLTAAGAAWSQPGQKSSVQELATKASTESKSENETGPKVDKGMKDQDGSQKSGDKAGNSVKKNAVKKAGAAAAVGVATKKVTSTIKK